LTPLLEPDLEPDDLPRDLPEDLPEEEELFLIFVGLERLPEDDLPERLLLPDLVEERYL
jgi:hypothetical protein